MSELTARQIKFCLEYANTGNAKQSAINAGYSRRTAKNQGQRLLKQENIQNYLKEITEGFISGKIADAEEMQKRLTAIIRGETLEEVIVVVGVGDGISEAVTKTKKPSVKDIITAIDKLARMQGAYDNSYYFNVVPVFEGESELEDSPHVAHNIDGEQP